MEIDGDPNNDNLENEDTITIGKHIIIRKAFDVSSCKLVKLCKERYFSTIFI